MVEMLRENLPVVLIVILIGLILAFLVFRPRQRVQLSSDTPVRPHMTAGRDPRGESNDILSEAAAAASDVTGEVIGAPVHRHLSASGDSSDDLQRIKGVGPKLADMLASRGYTSFARLARLTPAEIEILDEQLGPFRGRIQRDRIVEQAQYLERGDTDGFELQFGKL